MGKLEKNKKDARIEWVKNRLQDMDDDLSTGRVSDAIRVDFVSESTKLLKELKDAGVDFETPPAIIQLKASKAGISAAKSAAGTGMVDVPAPVVAADPVAKGPAVKPGK